MEINVKVPTRMQDITLDQYQRFLEECSNEDFIFPHDNAQISRATSGAKRHFLASAEFECYHVFQPEAQS